MLKRLLYEKATGKDLLLAGLKSDTFFTCPRWMLSVIVGLCG